ncbi:MAG: glycoside hydrolase family 130 protein [Planctomycetota bacterium]
MITRCPENPIIAPKDVKPSRPEFEVVCVFNCGVTRYEGDVLLLLRVAERVKATDPAICSVPLFDVEQGKVIIKDFPTDDPTIDYSDSRYVYTKDRIYLSSMSNFRVARSKDGVHFEIEDKPVLEPANEYEMYGIEDPRITLIGDTYYVNYSACSVTTGVTTSLATTKDFVTFERQGVIFPPDNKDVAIFPDKVGGKYYALHRPISYEYKTKDIWVAESPDLVCWGNHKRLISARPGMWDNGRIGCSAVPFRVDGGWLELYHGASVENRYCLGALLLDENDPSKVLARGEKPFMEPEADYEVNGFFGNVVFNCGVLVEDGTVKIYYGGADTVVGYAEAALEDIMSTLK